MHKLRVVLPRTIKANRGDLASRWVLLRALMKFPHVEPIVFAQFLEDVPLDAHLVLPYGRLRNIFLSREGRRALQKAGFVFWAVGLDMQDDSSLAKLIYLNVVFKLYHILGKPIWCLFQGAGPIQTRAGRFLLHAALSNVDLFVARDPQTYAMIKEISQHPEVILGHDAIFLPGVEKDLSACSSEEKIWVNSLFNCDCPVIGVNIRQWFHFSSSLIPYQFARNQYQARSHTKMEELLSRTADLVAYLRKTYQARVLLISAYQPGIETWEDDLSWLRLVKKKFSSDDEVQLIERRLSIPAYFRLMSRLKLVIGMRLHTALIALRFGVPAINLSYTLKGSAIMNYLGLGDNVFELIQFLKGNPAFYQRVSKILAHQTEESDRTLACVEQAVEQNMTVLRSLIERKMH